MWACRGHNPGESLHPAFALVTCAPVPNVIPLCKPILDIWLDNADDGLGDEPAELRFLATVEGGS